MGNFPGALSIVLAKQGSLMLSSMHPIASWSAANPWGRTAYCIGQHTVTTVVLALLSPATGHKKAAELATEEEEL